MACRFTQSRLQAPSIAQIVKVSTGVQVLYLVLYGSMKNLPSTIVLPTGTVVPLHKVLILLLLYMDNNLWWKLEYSIRQYKYYQYK